MAGIEEVFEGRVLSENEKGFEESECGRINSSAIWRDILFSRGRQCTTTVISVDVKGEEI